MNPESVFVTGGSGLVGSHLVNRLGIGCGRLELTSDAGWEKAFAGKAGVIHCAALASGRGVSPDRVKEVNVEGTRRVARLARESGVRRFLFLSSVKVFGEFTRPGEPFQDDSPLQPQSVYGLSKAMGENLLRGMHQPGGFEVVILRPTVVISPRSKGAVGTMARFARKGLPFPVPSEGNLRDFVNIDNLADAVLAALDHPEAGGRAFSVTDGGAVGTAELFQAMAKAQGKRARLVRLSRQRLGNAAGWLGRSAALERILGHLEVSDTRIRETLGWKPGLGTIDYVRECWVGD